ncbi:transposase, partial [Providencia rettgeri]|uniref:transposase n=1 Tax=Providencia rettgeri TaxID=587 RepID=UPI0019D43F3C
MGDEKSLAHTRWNCKYHIVFAPKYRRQVFYGEKRRAIGSILRQVFYGEKRRAIGSILRKLCEWK